ncbi:orotate phosphoribosyltransferase [Salmonella enterica]|nr:orotate phosphoribosyltransferase [Salmonella enterica]
MGCGIAEWSQQARRTTRARVGSSAASDEYKRRLQGRVMLMDDVITAGTAIRESMEINLHRLANRRTCGNHVIHQHHAAL